MTAAERREQSITGDADGARARGEGRRPREDENDPSTSPCGTQREAFATGASGKHLKCTGSMNASAPSLAHTNGNVFVSSTAEDSADLSDQPLAPVTGETGKRAWQVLTAPEV